jgi:short-subunit dehydrogenase
MKAPKRYTLITGATSGIGYELAKLFAKNGHDLIIVARHEEDLQNTSVELTQQFGIDVVKISKDLFIPQNAFDLYNEIIEKGLQVDILVNDAGQGHYGEFVDTDIIRDLEIIQLNISSLVILTKLFLQDMVNRNEGKILNLSSIASKAPGPFQSVYHGTKAFVQSFTEAIRDEVKDTDITITALLPGATDTDFFNKAGMLESKIVQEEKLDDAADVAKAGYDALMDDKDKVVAGFKNKVQVAMASITPDETLAKKMHKQQEPVTEEKKYDQH